MAWRKAALGDFWERSARVPNTDIAFSFSVMRVKYPCTVTGVSKKCRNIMLTLKEKSTCSSEKQTNFKPLFNRNIFK